MRIAIIGSGISGMMAAYLLNRNHDITLFESDDRLGGHTATKSVSVDGNEFAVDTGFIVYNDWTYPNFIRLLDELGIEGKKTSMSFSVTSPETGYEYSGCNMNTLFAQRTNLLNPAHYKMLADIVRFNREAEEDLDLGRVPEETTLGEYLSANKYGRYFIERYIVPMGAAIWSSGTSGMMGFPMRFFIRFFRNHGLLSIRNRPQWYVVPGGSAQYIEPLIRSFSDKIRLSTPVQMVRRMEGQAYVMTGQGTEIFDEVVFACHSNQALALLADASDEEKQVLEALPYSRNEVVLHTDETLLPKRQRAWAAWNYILDNANPGQAALTYNMNILQGIESGHQFCVTLNKTDAIDRSKILGEYEYDHPVFTTEGVEAQKRWSEINGVQNTWFCGAYWHNGFHEDGVRSAIRVASGLGVSWGDDARDSQEDDQTWKKAG